MKSHFLFFAVLALFAAAGRVAANTNYVVAGADFQAAINASAPGDTLIVQAGSYPDNVVFSNPITVLCSGTNPPATNILFQGTVQIQGTGPMYFAGCQFLNNASLLIQGSGAISFAQCSFTPAVQISRAGGISFNQCTIAATLSSSNANLYLANTRCSTFSVNLLGLVGTNFQAFDSAFADTYAYGGKITLKRCSINGLYLTNNCSFDGLRVTNYYYTSGVASNDSGTTFILAQSSFWFNPDDAISLNLTGYQLWLGYNFIGPTTAYQCDSFLIGNTFSGFDALPQHPVSAFYAKGGSVIAYNNLLTPYGYAGEGGYWDTFVYGFQLDGSGGMLVNNTICITNNASQVAHSRGILITNASVPFTIAACIISIVVPVGSPDSIGIGCYGAGLANVSYSDVQAGSIGIVPANCINVDPQFNSSCTLGPGSPCIGAGPPDPIYFNRATTNRNDMGWTGGPYYNAANLTTSYPMIFFLNGAPQNVFKGQQTNILVNVAASAGH